MKELNKNCIEYMKSRFKDIEEIPTTIISQTETTKELLYNSVFENKLYSVNLLCKLGDEVYYISTLFDPIIIPSKVATLTVHDKVIIANLNNSCRYIAFDFNGNIIENNWEVYLTYEQAEKRLEELKNLNKN